MNDLPKENKVKIFAIIALLVALIAFASAQDAVDSASVPSLSNESRPFAIVTIDAAGKLAADDVQGAGNNLCINTTTNDIYRSSGPC